MSGHDTTSCEGCGRVFTFERGRPGRLPRHCSATCRGRAAQARKRGRLAAEVTSLALTASDRALLGAVAALPTSALVTLRRELLRAVQPVSRDEGIGGIVYDRHNPADGVVVDLHNPKEG